MQYTLMSDGQISTQTHFASHSDPALTAIGQDMFWGRKINVAFTFDDDNYVITFKSYRTDATFSFSVPKNRISDSGRFRHEPYLGIMMNNYYSEPREMGFVISNIRNGNVRELSIANASKEPIELQFGANEALSVNYTLWQGVESSFKPELTWSSSDTSIVTVDAQTGLIQGIAAGNAMITCMDSEGNTASVEVAIDVNSIVLVGEAERTVLYQSEPLVLQATVEPASVKVLWSSSDPSIATVDENGKLTYVGAGKVVITGYAGLKSVTVTLTIDADSVTIGKETLALDVYDSYRLRATTDIPNPLWSSSDPSVAIVDADGKVTAVGAGTATIIVTCGTRTDTCTVTVTGRDAFNEDGKTPGEVGPGDGEIVSPEKKNWQGFVIGGVALAVILVLIGVTVLMVIREKK